MFSARLGSRVGPRIATLVSRAIVATHNGLHSAKHKLAMAVFRSISDEISHEVDVSLGPVLRELAEHDGMPEELREHFKFMAYGHGQLKALVGTSLAGAGILDPVAKILTNLLNPAVLATVAVTPNAVPDPGTISQIFAQGIASHGELDSAMRGQGLGDNWIRDLYEMAQTYPGIDQTLEMFRRGDIGDQTALLWIRRNGVPIDAAGKLLGLARVELSPADAALAVLRGNLSHAEGQAIAAKSGISSADFDTMIGNTGEPPGVMELLEAYRRGFIGQGELEKGIRQSRYRDEWIPTIEKLRYSPMSTADAVRAVVQNQMSDAEGQRIAEQNGLEPSHWRALVDAFGSPLSLTEMTELYNRGQVSQGEVEQALRESRLKNKYVSLAFKLHEKVIPLMTLQRALQHGSISHDDAIRIVRHNGYSATDAEMIVKAGTDQRLQVFRDRVVSAIETLYEDSGIAQDHAHTLVKGMGYSDDESRFILQAAEYRRTSRVTTSVLNNVRSRYVARHIDEHAASGHMDALGIPSQQRDQLLKLWGIERESSVRVLTESQIVKAVKKQLIDPNDGLARLQHIGYSTGDAELLLEMM